MPEVAAGKLTQPGQDGGYQTLGPLRKARHTNHSCIFFFLRPSIDKMYNFRMNARLDDESRK